MIQEIQIELAGVCNATCVYCTWQTRTLGKQIMKTELALRLLDEAKALGIQSVRYHGLGESTVHPELEKILVHGEVLGLNHSLSTNCYVLDECAAICHLKGLHMILAVPWVMPNGFVETCVKNALNYVLQPDLANHRIHIQMVCHEGARAHYDRFIATFLGVAEQLPNVYLHLKQPVTWPSDTPNKGFIEPELAKHPKVIFDARATPLSIGKGCNQPERFLMVLADGSCTPCCVDANSWGLPDVKKGSLREVWESARRAEIVKLWKSADNSIPCGHCKKRADCIQ